MIQNPRYVQKPEAFKFCEFLPEKKQLILCREKIVRFLLFFLSVLFGIPIIVLSFFFELKEEYRNQVVRGAMIQTVIFCFILNSYFDG